MRVDIFQLTMSIRTADFELLWTLINKISEHIHMLQMAVHEEMA